LLRRKFQGAAGIRIFLHYPILTFSKTGAPQSVRAKLVYKFWKAALGKDHQLGPDGGMGHSPEVFQHNL